MRSLILLAAVAAVAGCSRPVMHPGAEAAQALAGRVPGAPELCVSTNAAENLHVLDPQTVAYGNGRTIYVNHLASVCPGISHFNTLIVEGSAGGQYCRGDRIRGLEPGTSIPGPSCNLNEWVPYRLP
ncbi:hypothetical protein ACUXST_000484 [Sphingomonas sp. F9_3S_D5_B_2]